MIMIFINAKKLLGNSCMTEGTDKTKNTLVQRIFVFFLVYRVFQKL
jgi:hypothetical protein